MTTSIPAEHQALLSRFESHLVATGFARIHLAAHVERVEAFLAYLHEVQIAPEAVSPVDLSRYLRAQLQRYRRKHGRSPKSPASWHHRQSGGVHRFLAVVQGRWPPAFVATNEHDCSINAVLIEYERFSRERRALAASTIVCCMDEARRFLRQLPDGDLASALLRISVGTIDRYIQSRTATGMARSTCRTLCNNLRSILRFLHSTGRISRDLASAIITPSTYRYEGLPSTISSEQIRTVLASARKDHSPMGSATMRFSCSWQPTDCAPARSASCGSMKSTGRVDACGFVIARPPPSPVFHFFRSLAQRFSTTYAVLARSVRTERSSSG
jgi:integrase/recombinase XerD